MGHPIPTHHSISPWMRPYPIEQWPQEHHARQGPQVPTARHTRFTNEHFPLRPQAPYISSPTETTFLIHAPAPVQRAMASHRDTNSLDIPSPPQQPIASQQATNPLETSSPEDSPMLNLQASPNRESESFTSTLLDTDFSYVWSEENTYRKEESTHTSGPASQSELLDERQEPEDKDSPHTQTNTTQSDPLLEGYDQEACVLSKAVPPMGQGSTNNNGGTGLSLNGEMLPLNGGQCK